MKEGFVDVGLAMATEALSASLRFGRFNSAHEGYGVLLEEFEELWDEIKKKREDRDPQRLRREAIHVGAMAIRFINDLCGGSE